MNAIDILGISKKKNSYPEFQHATVIKSVSGGEKEIDFKYANIAGSKYTLTSVALPGLETPVPTKTIFTSRLDIPFATGDSVAIDGAIWTVADLERSYDNKAAQLTGKAEKGWTLYLNGGKGNG